MLRQKRTTRRPGLDSLRPKNTLRFSILGSPISTNGKGIVEFDYTTGIERSVDCFPTAHELWTWLNAGIWDEWQLDGTSITSCAIITTTPNKLLATIHDRMPVILLNEGLDGWLRSNAKLSELRKLLSPFPDSEMQGFPVSPEVNGSHARLVERLEASEDVGDAMLF
ncbi:MAG TPA: hypothetical protein DCK93_00845 [Blastocatellia bacterium]|nr:hypothetical protein [Blastocatellia bacterium]HAF21453.1 hypothetical protein [Blastocatellia bacterium]